MAEQQALFDESTVQYGGVDVPAQRHSDTSRAAAESVRPKAGTLRALVLEFLEDAGARGATDEEMQRAIGLDPSTQRPRRIELVKQGRVVDSGTTRNTRSGRAAVVWRAREKT